MLKSKLQYHFVNFLAKHLFNVITEKDIIQISYNQDGTLNDMFVKGKKLRNQEIGLIVEQARNLQRSALWRYLCDDIKFQTNTRMFEKSKTEADILAGKMVLWGLRSMNKKIDELVKLASYEPKS